MPATHCTRSRLSRSTMLLMFVALFALLLLVVIFILAARATLSTCYAGGFIFPALCEWRRDPFRVASDADCATLTRALNTERILVVERPEPTETRASARWPRATFKLLGTSGCVYTATLCEYPSCDCPAFITRRGAAQCKHLAWLKLRVFGVPAAHYLAVQTAYLSWELRYMMSHARKAAGVSRAVKDALVGAAAAARPSTTTCSICYDELGTAAPATCAASCGTPFHTDCVRRYNDSQRADGAAPRCAACRAPWADELPVSRVASKLGEWVAVAHPAGKARRERSRVRRG